MQCNVCMYDISIGRLRCLYLDWYMYSICTDIISVQNHDPKDLTRPCFMPSERDVIAAMTAMTAMMCSCIWRGFGT